MKRLLLLSCFLLLITSSFAQTKVITLNNGDKYEGIIEREDDMYFYFILSGDEAQTVHKINKNQVNRIEDSEFTSSDTISNSTVSKSITTFTSADYLKQAGRQIKTAATFSFLGTITFYTPSLYFLLTNDVPGSDFINTTLVTGIALNVIALVCFCNAGNSLIKAGNKLNVSPAGLTYSF